MLHAKTQRKSFSIFLFTKTIFLTLLNNFRQWMLQRAIEKAENDDFSEVRLLQKVLKTPFKAQPEAEAAGYAKPVPDWSKRLLLSCSS